MSTFRRVQYATTLQMQLGNWQALFGQWRRATKGYLPAHISAGSSGYPRPRFSANAEEDPALLALKHLICRHSSPTLICVGRTATFQRKALPNAYLSL